MTTMAWLGVVTTGSGCAPTYIGDSLPRGDAAYSAIPAVAPQQAVQDYRIGPLDTINVTVYQEPDLSATELQVDASGNIALPLLGRVAVAGKTAPGLSRELELMYGKDYLEHPQVTVSVNSSVSQKITIQGEVTEPGVYPIKGPTTLLEAISLAKGETRVASLSRVAIFRNAGGKRMGAVFDVGAVRRGEVPDPALLGNDLVIVGYSQSRGIWRDTLSAAPLLNIFRPF